MGISATKLTTKQDVFILGGFIAMVGLYEMFVTLSYNNFMTGFFLIGVGVVLMASGSKRFRDRLTNFFMSIFEKLTNMLFNSNWS